MKTRKVTRREAFGMFGAAGAVATLGCGGSSPATPTTPSTPSTTTTTTPPTAAAACAVTPSETVGPFPSLTDLFRSDIRGGRNGTPLTLTITLVNTNNACAPVSGANVEIWQCDANGDYSQYNNQRAETFLRGFQMTNASGEVTFTTIYPGWYQGRATHIHVDVGRNGASIKVTQIAFPESVSAAVHATGVYASRGQNPTSNLGDMVFADSLSSELATVTGSPSAGYTATFRIGVAL
jgi:protocatechuate 3,4-dioxygenase beta subunit